MPPSTGTLFIVSTPIGNLGDLSPRAAKTLESVAYILCESVAHTRVILNTAKNLAIAAPDQVQDKGIFFPGNSEPATSGIDLESDSRIGRTLGERALHMPTSAFSSRRRASPEKNVSEFSSEQKNTATVIRYEGKGQKFDWQIQTVIADLRNGDSVALVSNAGTPLISDPGGKLVAEIVHAGLPVVHIPGPAAFVSAAVTSGLPTKNILYIGFLPKKTNALKQKLASARIALSAIGEPASLAAYVSKYQLEKTISALAEVFGGDAQISVARELTKLHEDHFTGPIADLKTWLSQSPHRRKGEFTLVIANPI